MTYTSCPAESCGTSKCSIQWVMITEKVEGRRQMPPYHIQTLSSFSNQVDNQDKNWLQLWRERIYWWRNLSWRTNAKPLGTKGFPPSFVKAEYKPWYPWWGLVMGRCSQKHIAHSTGEKDVCDAQESWRLQSFGVDKIVDGCVSPLSGLGVTPELCVCQFNHCFYYSNSNGKLED